MFEAVCKLGLEGIVSKKLYAPYRSGPSKSWIKERTRRQPRQCELLTGTSDRDGNRENVMRTITLTVIMFALVSQGGVAFAQQPKQKAATILSGMSVEIDSKGKAVILTPRSKSGVLEPLAIPISGANLLVKALQVKNCRSQGHCRQAAEAAITGAWYG